MNAEQARQLVYIAKLPSSTNYMETIYNDIRRKAEVGLRSCIISLDKLNVAIGDDILEKYNSLKSAYETIRQLLELNGYMTGELERDFTFKVEW